MLRNAKDLEGFAIGATDGAIGHVTDFLFDDEAWAVRFLVVKTGSWLADKHVLISPVSVGVADWAERTVPVSISRDQVKGSPDIDTERPVSRQLEVDYLTYYGYPYYWGGAGLWNGGVYPDMLTPGYVGFGSGDLQRSDVDRAYAAALKTRHENDDPHLRSCNAIVGCHVRALDGDIGHVEGMLLDEETWAIRYLLVNTSNWWLGHTVLVAPLWINDMSYADSKVSVDLTRAAVQNSHPYDPAVPIDRAHEIALHRHYGRVGYWSDDRLR